MTDDTTIYLDGFGTDEHKRRRWLCVLGGFGAAVLAFRGYQLMHGELLSGISFLLLSLS